MEAATPDRRSRQADMLSPRRLDALRKNGNSILQATVPNDLDAASTFKRTQDFRGHADHGSNYGTAVRAQHLAEMIDSRKLTEMDPEVQMGQ